jgi:hypothetical protein
MLLLAVEDRKYQYCGVTTSEATGDGSYSYLYTINSGGE